LNLAAVQIINASNIQVGGTSAGVPTLAAPNISGLTNASNTVAASSNAALQQTQNNAPASQQDVPSITSVEVLGYGGGEDEEERRQKKKQQQGLVPGRAEHVAANSNTTGGEVTLSVAFQPNR